MAYFIHNKYDVNSVAKVTLVSGTSYTYNADSTVQVIDYFGLLEKGDTTYKNLDTALMGISTVDALSYTVIDEANLIGNAQTSDGKSIPSYATGALPILELLQQAIGQPIDSGGSNIEGSVMAKLNALLSILAGTGSSVVRHIQRGSAIFASQGTSLEVALTGFTNLNKMIVLLDGPYMRTSTTSTASYVHPHVDDLTISAVTFSGPTKAASTVSFSYQVIEFY